MLKTILLSIAVLLVAVALVVGWAYWSFDAEIRSEVAELVEGARVPGITVTQDMLTGLPEPARRYLEHADIVGQTLPTTVRVTQTGSIRSSEDANWMELEGVETYSLDPPGFVWRAYIPAPSAPVVIGRDQYYAHAGSILMKMAALIPVADEHGPELGAAGLMRFLNEMVWFPSSFLLDSVTISPDAENSFQAQIADGDLTATATFFVDETGRLTNFRALRFNTTTGSEEIWETPYTGYTELAGMDLPTIGTAVWKLPDRDFTYIELTVTSVELDPEL